MIRGVIFLAAFVLSGAALAQPKDDINDAAKAMIGAWELSNAARDKACAVTFSPSAVKVGYKVVFAPECAALFPVVPNIAGWRYPDNDLLYWLDAKGNALIQFSEVEDGIFEAPTPGVGVLFLLNPATAAPEPNEPPGPAESPPGGERPDLPETPAPKSAPQSAPKPNGG
jgi:hypothetical protein